MYLTAYIKSVPIQWLGSGMKKKKIGSSDKTIFFKLYKKIMV